MALSPDILRIIMGSTGSGGSANYSPSGGFTPGGPSSMAGAGALMNGGAFGALGSRPGPMQGSFSPMGGFTPSQSSPMQPGGIAALLQHAMGGLGNGQRQGRGGGQPFGDPSQAMATNAQGALANIFGAQTKPMQVGYQQGAPSTGTPLSSLLGGFGNSRFR